MRNAENKLRSSIEVEYDFLVEQTRKRSEELVELVMLRGRRIQEMSAECPELHLLNGKLADGRTVSVHYKKYYIRPGELSGLRLLAVDIRNNNDDELGYGVDCFMAAKATWLENLSIRWLTSIGHRLGSNKVGSAEYGSNAVDLMEGIMRLKTYGVMLDLILGVRLTS